MMWVLTLRGPGTFLAGLLTTMVFVDVTKLMVGRLRPIFLEVCVVNTSLCFTADQRCDVSVCTQSDAGLLRWARSVSAVQLNPLTPTVAIWVHL